MLYGLGVGLGFAGVDLRIFEVLMIWELVLGVLVLGYCTLFVCSWEFWFLALMGLCWWFVCCVLDFGCLLGC